MSGECALTGLDIYDFLEPKWAIVTNTGAAALGVITPNQLINVLTLENGKKEHDDTIPLVLREIFDFENGGTKEEIENVSKYLIFLRYTNQKYRDEFIRRVIIYIPDNISEYQYEILCYLSKDFDELKELGLSTYVIGNKIDIDQDEENIENNLGKILASLEDRITQNSMLPLEWLASFDRNNTLITKKNNYKIA